MFRKWIIVVSVVSRLAVILLSVWNVRGGFIAVVLMCLGLLSCLLSSDQVYYQSLLLCWNVFVCRTCLGHNCSVEKKLEFKTGEDVLEEVEKFCYLGDLISCHGGASKAVITRIGNVWKKFRELSGVVVEKQGLSWKKWGMIYQWCITPLLLICTVVKHGNLLLQMRHSCISWSIEWSWCVGWN